MVQMLANPLKVLTVNTFSLCGKASGVISPRVHLETRQKQVEFYTNHGLPEERNIYSDYF